MVSRTPWKKWGPYLSERQWGTVREDYSENGDAWNFFPDSRDRTRRGLGLRVEVRGFQWANPQAQNVIFWHYDIVNESTTTYEDIVFGLYMDSGVGGSSQSCDGVAESDDDNAFFNRDFGLNLTHIDKRPSQRVNWESPRDRKRTRRCHSQWLMRWIQIACSPEYTSITSSRERAASGVSENNRHASNTFSKCCCVSRKLFDMTEHSVK